MKTKYTTDEIKAIVDGESANDAPVEEVARYYYDETDHEENSRPYTLDEINAMLDRAEAHLAAGLGIPGDVVMRQLREEFLHEMVEESELQISEGKFQDCEIMMHNLRNKYIGKHLKVDVA